MSGQPNRWNQSWHVQQKRTPNANLCYCEWKRELHKLQHLLPWDLCTFWVVALQWTADSAKHDILYQSKICAIKWFITQCKRITKKTYTKYWALMFFGCLIPFYTPCCWTVIAFELNWDDSLRQISAFLRFQYMTLRTNCSWQKNNEWNQQISHIAQISTIQRVYIKSVFVWGKSGRYGGTFVSESHEKKRVWNHHPSRRCHLRSPKLQWFKHWIYWSLRSANRSSECQQD